MLVAMIAALDRRGLIGAGAGLPWHLPGDLRRFRATTWGKPVLMGRTTFASLGKPLPGRFNIVLTRNPAYSAPGIQVARTLPEALSLAGEYLAGTDRDEAMVIGGGQVYAEAIPRWDRLYLTVVEGQFQGNTYFPVRELLRQRWRPACAPETHPPDGRNVYPYSFHIIERAWDVEREACRGERGQLSQASGNPDGGLEGLDLAALLARGNVDS